MLGYKLMAFVGLRNAEGPNEVRIMDTDYGLLRILRILWMEVHVFRVYFGLGVTDLKCYDFTRYLLLVCKKHDFKLHVQDFGLNKKHAVR